jgi:hypothetical protein
MNGLFKLPGNTKWQTGKRGQRANHDLRVDLPPLSGTERYEEIMSREEFHANRPWLDEDEAAAAIWPRKDRHLIAAPSLSLGWLESYYRTWNWPLLRKRWGEQLVPYYLDYDHMVSGPRKTVDDIPRVDKADGRLISVHVVPSSRWLVIALDAECPGVHDRHDPCERCWGQHRENVRRARELFSHRLEVIYTGGNGVHVWIEITKADERLTYASTGARQLMAKHTGLPIVESGAAIRVPGALHEKTGRPSCPISWEMPWPPVK